MLWLMCTLAVWLVTWGVALLAARMCLSKVPRLSSLMSPVAVGAADDSLVSLIVPVRNEVQYLERSLASWLAQSHARIEIVFVDDGSVDGSRAIMERAARSSEKVKVVSCPARPHDWLGKHNAMASGARVAAGRWLLFTDGDVRFAPTVVADALAYASQDLDCLSLLHRVHGVGWSECACLPLRLLASLIAKAHRCNGPGGDGGFANGAFILIRKSAYESIGGHDRIRSHPLDDVALGRLVKQSSLRIALVRAPEAVEARAYPGGTREMFIGMIKNVTYGFGGFRGRPILGALLACGVTVLCWVPLAVAIAAAHDGAYMVCVSAAVTAATLPAMAVAAAGRDFRVNKWYTMLYPAGACLVLAAQLVAAYYAVRFGGNSWRGRMVAGVLNS